MLHICKCIGEAYPLDTARFLEAMMWISFPNIFAIPDHLVGILLISYTVLQVADTYMVFSVQQAAR